VGHTLRWAGEPRPGLATGFVPFSPPVRVLTSTIDPGGAVLGVADIPAPHPHYTGENRTPKQTVVGPSWR